MNRTERIEINFDFDWKFSKGDPQDAWTAEFDDEAWRMLDLPHDWSIEDLDPEALPDTATWEGPFMPRV